MGGGEERFPGTIYTSTVNQGVIALGQEAIFNQLY